MRNAPREVGQQPAHARRCDTDAGNQSGEVVVCTQVTEDGDHQHDVQVTARKLPM